VRRFAIMSRLSFARVPLFALVMTGAASIGCSAIPVHMHTESHVQHMDGTVEHKSSDWHGTLDQLPAQLAKAGKELGEVTAKMAKELTDVPPPGKVEMKDLSPELAKYQGKRGADFLSTAKDEDGKPITFSYVRLGVREYDEFFKTSQEIYALLYETTQVIGQMRQVSAKLLDTKPDAAGDLKATVTKALRSEGDEKLSGTLRSLEEMGATLATLVPQIVNKLGKLVSTGEALVASAASSLTNPKIVTHLGLVKDGLVSSIKVVKESGSLMVTFSKDLAGFKA
jgi:hypothetical protein